MLKTMSQRHQEKMSEQMEETKEERKTVAKKIEQKRFAIVKMNFSKDQLSEDIAREEATIATQKRMLECRAIEAALARAKERKRSLYVKRETQRLDEKNKDLEKKERELKWLNERIDNERQRNLEREMKCIAIDKRIRKKFRFLSKLKDRNTTSSSYSQTVPPFTFQPLKLTTLCFVVSFWIIFVLYVLFVGSLFLWI